MSKELKTELTETETSTKNPIGFPNFMSESNEKSLGCPKFIKNEDGVQMECCNACGCCSCLCHKYCLGGTALALVLVIIISFVMSIKTCAADCEAVGLTCDTAVGFCVHTPR